MIEVRHFKKTFRVGFRGKKVEAVKDVNLSVEPGEIYGFLGPNGAGKTTTMKALLGLIRPDGGVLELVGHPVESGRWRGRVGFMPEHPSFYDYLTGREMVTWFGRLSGLTAHQASRDASRMLDRVGLHDAMDRRLRGFSKGMLQRAGLAQALMGNPELLILDEPMTGLDPLGRKFMRELILELASEGRTIFYSTHILPDVELTCQRVAIVHHGRTVRVGDIHQILDETTRGVTMELKTDANLSAVLGLSGRLSTSTGGRVAGEFDDEGEARHVVGRALALGAQLLKFEPHRDDLETIFVRSLSEPDTLEMTE
ncbi:MAG: ABC transporter ATP-binding protein [Myxococcota bacterium]